MSHLPISLALTCAILIACSVGCNQVEPITTYTIPTEMPEQFKAGEERMLAAMVPRGEEVWFFKVTGPEEPIASIEETFRDFVSKIEISNQGPDLTELPNDWRRGASKPFRFASINVSTPQKQLDVSVSKLTRQDDWDAMVKMNVNRWRGQLGLESSDAKWAEGEAFEVAAADATGIWVDITGLPPSDKPSMQTPMQPPFAGASAPIASQPQTPPQESTSEPDSRLKFDRPEGWRDGRMSSMRMAAFNVGPEDASAEITVIPAGGDIRGNVARWLGQVMSGSAPDDVVDEAMENASEVTVNGLDGQRFFLTSKDDNAGQAIDATIVPLDSGIKLFVKMTGPRETVAAQSDAITSFLDSLTFDLE